MKRKTILTSILVLLCASTAQAQYSQDSPAYISKTHPGKLVRDYDQIYLDGRKMKSYEMIKVLSPTEFVVYEKYRKRYVASEWVGFAGTLTTIIGGTVMALSYSYPDKVPRALGEGLAIGGGIALFAVSIPLDINGQKGLRKFTREYNDKH